MFTSPPGLCSTGTGAGRVSVCAARSGAVAIITAATKRQIARIRVIVFRSFTSFRGAERSSDVVTFSGFAPNVARQRHAAGQKNPDPFLDGKIRKACPIARVKNDVAEIK